MLLLGTWLVTNRWMTSLVKEMCAEIVSVIPMTKKLYVLTGDSLYSLLDASVITEALIKTVFTSLRPRVATWRMTWIYKIIVKKRFLLSTYWDFGLVCYCNFSWLIHQLLLVTCYWYSGTYKAKFYLLFVLKNGRRKVLRKEGESREREMSLGCCSCFSSFPSFFSHLPITNFEP